MDSSVNNNSLCNVCPRHCKKDRAHGSLGYCGVSHEIKIARCALHQWEEPPISGENGSGTIFFSGCNLRCIYCQNHAVSHEGLGRRISEDELIEMMFSLKAQGAHNINLVTPTHYTDVIVKVLTEIKQELALPIVWNSGGYDSVPSLEKLCGLVDIYLPDLKYADRELALRYSGAADYPEVAEAAIKEMYRQVGKFELDENGIMTRGLIVRHLVLPGCRKNSLEVLERLHNIVPVESIKLSLMSQYTPDFAMGCGYKNLERRITGFEYSSVLERAEELGFDGYFQDRSSANKSYTPEFFGDSE